MSNHKDDAVYFSEMLWQWWSISNAVKLDDLGEEMDPDKVNILWSSPSSKLLQNPHSDRHNVVQSGMFWSWWLKKPKLHLEREFVKYCLIATAELPEPDKVQLFHSVSWSERTVTDWITDMARYQWKRKPHEMSCSALRPVLKQQT